MIVELSSDLVNTILGAGGLAFLYALGQGVRWMVDRASAREDKVETQTKDWQRTTYKRLTFEAKQHDYWREYANRLEGVIIRGLGEDKLPKKRPYPKESREDDDDLKALEP